MAVEFSYAQARAQARQGDRLSADTWGLLESSVGLAQFLHLLRGTALASRVEHFSATTSPHVIERFLRLEWHREVDLAKRWVPARWRAAVAWTAWLAELPAISHLLQGGAAPAWMNEDPFLSPFAAEDADIVRSAIEEALPGLGADDGSGDDGRAGWLRHWRALWPDEAAGDPALADLVSLLGRPGIVGDAKGVDDWRRDLELHALRILHGRREQPVTVYCHLLLSALELHRLRQGLLQRALFNDLDRGAAA
ncbi:MAG: hypothetical protein OES93_08525 [Gammaproteobacteria bacterium]|jgi:hypothetical protein|nr:hypothetical protein [Gammaproteobacteria bacterium]MDH3846961.1 hypothetical protein [Gammaproteobacteria bacterium]MDH3904942.1 hypothetical protein [Gammaproteobacteria bacterium]MDH3908445.1 hypothetical protein [Gammaproteobacteria bacterium]